MADNDEPTLTLTEKVQPMPWVTATMRHRGGVDGTQCFTVESLYGGWPVEEIDGLVAWVKAAGKRLRRAAADWPTSTPPVGGESDER